MKKTVKHQDPDFGCQLVIRKDDPRKKPRVYIITAQGEEMNLISKRTLKKFLQLNNFSDKLTEILCSEVGE